MFRRLILPALLCLTAALGTGLAYLVLAQPLYTAQSALFIEPRQRRVVSEDVNASGITDVALFESQVAILGSDAVLRRAVEALKLNQDPEFSPSGRRGPLSQLRERFSGPKPTQNATDRAVEEVARKVRIRRALNTYVVTVDATSVTPAKAAALANAILDAYLEDQARTRAETAAKVNALIDSRLGEIRANVRAAETAVDAFRRQSNIVTSEGGLLNEQQLTRLNTELVAVRALVASTKAKFDEVTATLQRGASPDAIPEAMASPVVQRLRDQHANTLRREAALSSQLGPRHPLMADARAQVESSRNQITTELQRVARQTEAEFQIATAREREISARIETLEKDVAGTATAQIRLRELEREADASREVLRTFLARAKETQEEQNLSKADARIITPAAIPPAPSSPNPLLVLALSGFAGLGATGLYALLRGVPAPIAPMPRASPLAPMAARRPVVQMAPDVLGQLPPLATRGRLTRTFSGTPGVRMTDVLTAITDGTRPEEIAFRDAMKTTAAAVRKSWTGPMGTQVVLVMSETRGIASSMTALGLAYVEAAAGRPTFLIDGASADPRLSTEFASDLNQERPCVLDSKEHLLEISSRDPQSGLMFLPIALANLDGLSEAQRLRLSMGVSRLAEDVDLIVIDGGAVSDSTGVAALAGQVTTLVVAGSQGTETDVRAVADAVRVPQAKLAGLVRVGS